MSDATEYVAPTDEMLTPAPQESVEPPPPTAIATDEHTDTPPAPVAAPPANDAVLASALKVYQGLLQQLETNKQILHTTRYELAQVRQQIRELSTLIKRDARLEDDTDSHGLHTNKVAAQYDDCGSIIAYAEQVRRHVYDNISEAEDLLSPMSQSVDLLKWRVRYIRLLETLLTAQESGLRLEIQQRNADACIWQLADILKV